MDILGFIPSFGGLIYTLGAFIIALSIIVAVHEYGHYIVARWCGIHSEVFSLGFGPRLFTWRDKRGTQWQIAAIPLGGYVRFMGDSDAASGRDEQALAGMDSAMRRRAMHTAPLWARAATVAAGPVFNFILSITVFTAIIMIQGQARTPLTVASLSPMPGLEMQLRPGDQILQIDARDVPGFDDFNGFVKDLPRTSPLDYTVLRNGDERVVPGPFPFPPLVAGVSPKSAAFQAGLKEGDVILRVGDAAIATFDDLRAEVLASGGATINLTVWRDGSEFEVALTPKSMDVPTASGGFETRYLIGVTGGLFFTPETTTPSPFSALWSGISQTGYIVWQSLSGLYHMITGAISSCNLSGPIGIAETSGQAASQGIVSFIWFIAVLSTAVGMINLFPVPVLDGGHLVFFAYEAVFRRPPSDGVLRILMGGGLALILSLMVFALSNDLFCP